MQEDHSPINRAQWSFGQLLTWHLMRGTRPGGTLEIPGRRWSNSAFADATGLNNRTIRYWLTDQHLPPETETIERILFENDICYAEWRLELREKHERSVAGKKSTPVLASAADALASVDVSDVERGPLHAYLKIAIAFVDQLPLASQYVWPQVIIGDHRRSDAKESDARQFILDMIGRRQRRTILVLGNYGYGKTSLCYMLGRTLAQQAIQQSSNTILPIYVSMRSLDQKEDIFTSIGRYLTSLGAEIQGSALRRLCIERGNIVFFLDGLDEIVDRVGFADLARIISKLDDLRQASNSAILITARSTFFTSDLEIDQIGADHVLHLSSFSDDHITSALNNANIDNLDKIRSSFDQYPGLRELCRTPIHLYLYIHNFQNNYDHTNSKRFGENYGVEVLYDRFIKHTVKVNQVVKVGRWRIEERLGALSRLAYCWYSRRIFSWPIVEFERFIHQLYPHLNGKTVTDYAMYLASCSVFERRRNQYRFIHASLMEYLTATYLVDQCFDGRFDDWEIALYTEIYEFVFRIMRQRRGEGLQEAIEVMLRRGGVKARANFGGMACMYKLREFLPFLRRLAMSSADLHRALAMQAIGIYPPSPEDIDLILSIVEREPNGIVRGMASLICSKWLGNFEVRYRSQDVKIAGEMEIEVSLEDAQRILETDQDGGIVNAYRRALMQPGAEWATQTMCTLILGAKRDAQSLPSIRSIAASTEMKELCRAYRAVECHSLISGQNEIASHRRTDQIRIA
jgi:hypothetical protein